MSCLVGMSWPRRSLGDFRPFPPHWSTGHIVHVSLVSGDAFSRCDDFGPAKVVHLSESRTGLRAVVVVDNVAAGPAIGGVRMASNMTTDVCVRLARAMSLKNAMAGLRHGGGKSGIIAAATIAPADKERLVRAFAAGIRDLADYIPGPDMGTDEAAMAWVHDEIGRAVGLPAELGGLPLDELGATGFGVAVAADMAADRAGVDLDGARVVIQGYGNVGRHAARFLAERGCIVVAAADSRGAVADAAGLAIDALDELKHGGHSVADHPSGGLPRDAVIDVECDIWIPAAGPDVITADNVDRLRTHMVVQGANIAVTPAAETRLHEKAVVSVPDFIANAGGVICAAAELTHGSQRLAFEEIEERVRSNTDVVLEESASSGEPPRDVAMAMAHDRVRQAMAMRRWN